jgi:hypothetical protein
MDAEWNFLAVSHGKHACDGSGRTDKRLARKQSLQNPYAEQVTMSRQLYKWAVVKRSSVTFEYFTIDDCRKEAVMLEERFRKAQALRGTQKYIISFLTQKTKFRQKCFRGRCVQHQTCSTH